MTPKQFRAALARLGLSQVAAARRLGVSARTVRFWIAGRHKIPEPVVMLLKVWLREQRTR